MKGKLPKFTEQEQAAHVAELLVKVLAEDGMNYAINCKCIYESAFAKELEEADARLSEMLYGGGLAMSPLDPVGQFDRLTAAGYKLDLVRGRYAEGKK